MLINEIAKKCNITKKAVQYYVEQGMLIPKILENGYKDFSEQDAEILKQIALYRKLGFSTSEIKRVFHDESAVTHMLYQRTLEVEREKVKLELLKRLDAGEKIEALEEEINHINSNTIIIKKLMELFPSYYGKFISLNFSRYLTGEIETEEQMRAFRQIVEFFDNVPDIDLPEDLQQYLDEYLEMYSGEEGVEKIQHILEGKDRAVRNMDEFVKNNKDILDAYKKYKETDAYKNSPAFRFSEYMKQVCMTNGYYDVFIPAMRKLSPLYNEYYEQMIKANDEFIRCYPEYFE
ncbi:MAG: MerR family transcriptional regulator [Lachnospiraceae bacterium]|nr:MerR family transcriptional regulator [Lachnospiraceae bacterium]